MDQPKANLLIVEDDTSLRAMLSSLLAEIGYGVRTSENGIAALMALRTEVPDILLSDLDMPVMSGFELLTVVRQRFPGMRAVAMSASFAGEQIPFGVMADAFHDKGRSVAALLGKLDTPVRREGMPGESAGTFRVEAMTPSWMVNRIHELAGAEDAMICCPECFRAVFPGVGEADLRGREAVCAYCRAPIELPFVPASMGPVYPFEPRERESRTVAKDPMQARIERGQNHAHDC